MEKLLIYRERLLKFVAAKGKYVQAVTRFIGGVLLFFTVGQIYGYTEILDQSFFLTVMGLICIFVPTSAVSLMFHGVIVLQLAHISIEIMLCYLLLILFYNLTYQRNFPKTRLYLMMTPVFFYFHIPAFLPLFIGSFVGIMGLPSILMGAICYYIASIVQYAVIEIDAGTISEEVYSLVIERIFDSTELLLCLVVFSLVTAIVSVIRKKGNGHGWNIAIITGGVVYLVMMFIGGYFTYSEVSILSETFMIFLSVFVALVLQFFHIVVDYTREETFEFEDEEYYYYVKAVPKVSVEEEDINITNITKPSRRFSLKRKDRDDIRDKEEGEET